MKATQQLKDEHEGIKLMLNIMEVISNDLENGKKLNAAHYENILDFIKVFADKCHHGKEETILFPAMEAKGYSHDTGPIAVMLDEHTLGRGYIKSLSNSFEAYKNDNTKGIAGICRKLTQLCNLLRAHIDKENNVLFMMADRALNENEQHEIFEAFEQLETEVIGKGKHKQYHALLKELKSIYL